MVHQILQSLGGSADAVADTLRREGVRGVRNTVRFLNPIVCFVQRQVTAKDVDVMQGDRLRITNADGTMEEAILPGTVVDFLRAFNQGAYPDLES